MPYVGIDLGATFLKGALLDLETDTVSASMRVPFPDFEPGLLPGRREVRIDAILAAVDRLLSSLLDAAQNRCDGILLCGQMHGTVLLDTGRGTLGNFISWQDSRCLAASDDAPAPFVHLLSLLGPARVRETGNELRPGIALSTLHAMRLAGELPRGLTPLSLADAAVWHLTAGEAASDHTNAAGLGLLKVADLTWHREVAELAGLGDLELPRLTEPGTVLGHCQLRNMSIPVHAPLGDQQAALLGAGLKSRELSLNIATGSQVSALSGTPEAGEAQLRPFPGGQWLRTVTHLPAGRSLNRLLGLLGELAAAQGTPVDDPWALASALAEKANPQTLRMDLSFFPAAFGSTGHISNIREDELTAGALFRAALASMADNYVRAANLVAPSGWDRLVYSGGLAQKSGLLRHEIERRLGSSNRVAPQAEDTLAGLLHLARRAP